MQVKPTVERLKELYTYNPDTGIFRYDYQTTQINFGTVAGYINSNGHRQINVDDRLYMAHNLAWLYMLGVFPPKGFIIDHIDRDYDNNRWSNFRLATLSMNQGNSKLRKDSTTGLKGVSWISTKGKYTAQIGIKGKRKFLGYFSDPKLAKAAYDKAAREYFGEFACLNPDTTS